MNYDDCLFKNLNSSGCAIKNYFEDTDDNYLKCYTKTNSSNLNDFYNSFPDIKFNLDEGVILNWIPSNYLIKNKRDEYCVGFLNMG